MAGKKPEAHLKQTKKASAFESILNILIGFGIQYFTLYGMAHLLGHPLSHSSTFTIGVVATITSFLRSFYLRRLFETLRVKGILPL